MAPSSSKMETELKYRNLQQIVKLMNDYFQINSEELLQQISKHLQIISLTNDLTIFDPYIKETTEFFITLNHFMNIIDIRSTIIWYCIDVLNNLCKNPAARQLLMTTYQFIPCLGRALGDHLTLQKRIQLLKLIQDLTCGIQIKWQIPYLTHLIRILVNWIECPDQQIVTLSLGVLVNLCYNNLPAINTLSGNVDTKRLLRICTTLNGPIVELHTCRLLMILDFMDEKLEIITKLVDLTLQSIVDGFRERNITILRQIIGFFTNNKHRKQLNHVIRTNNFEQQFIAIFKLISNNNDDSSSSERMDTNDDCIDLCECMRLVFEFFNLIDFKVLKTNYKLLIKLAMDWLGNDSTTIQSVLLLKNIATNIDNENEALQPSIRILPVFLDNLETLHNNNNDGNSDEFVNTGLYRKITSLLQLIKVMLHVNSIRPRILTDLTIDRISKIFLQLINDERIGKFNTNQPPIEIINIYINALSLINEFVKFDCSWSNFQTTLLQNRQIHLILAQGLLISDKQTKCLIMEMMVFVNFPKEAVCELLENLQLNSTTTTTMVEKRSHQLYQDYNNGPVLTVQQIQNLDEILNKFKTTPPINDNNNLLNATTCDIMQLYEYKLITNNYNQRLLEDNIELLTENITKLRHHIIQLKTETNHYHQLLLHSEKSQIDNKNVMELLKKDITDLTNRTDSYKGKLKLLQQQLNDKSVELNKLRDEYDERLKKANDNNKKLELENNQLKQCINKIQENTNKLEQKLQMKDEQIKQADCTIYNLNMQVKELEESLAMKNDRLNSINNELVEVRRDALAKKKIVDAITKLATSHQHVSDSP